VPEGQRDVPDRLQQVRQRLPGRHADPVGQGGLGAGGARSARPSVRVARPVALQEAGLNFSEVYQDDEALQDDAERLRASPDDATLRVPGGVLGSRKPSLFEVLARHRLSAATGSDSPRRFSNVSAAGTGQSQEGAADGSAADPTLLGHNMCVPRNFLPVSPPVRQSMSQVQLSPENVDNEQSTGQAHSRAYNAAILCKILGHDQERKFRHVAGEHER